MFARGLSCLAPLLALFIVTCAPPPRPPLPPAQVSLPIVPMGPPPGTAQAQSAVLPPPAPPMRNAAELRAQFGVPDFVRKETDSELWRYDGQDCALFAMLYRMNDDFLVRHIETLPAGAGTAVDEKCIASVRTRANQPS